MAIKRSLAAGTVAVMLLGAGCAGDSGGPTALHDQVSLLRLPEGGRLPRALIDERGVVHVVYFEGEPQAGDLRYVTRAPGESAWSELRYVNSQRGTVVGIGPIDGGQLALGRDGRLHVVWFKLGRTEFLYTRTNDAGTGFEPQFALAGGEGVEAGPSVAADESGNVYIFWHTGEPPDAERAVFMAASQDDGRTFSIPRPVSPAAEGACDCCGLHALAGASGSSQGDVYVSYRGAGDNIRRSQRLLVSGDRGETFTDRELDPWEINACPISTTSLANGPDGVTVAWGNGRSGLLQEDPRQRSVPVAGRRHAGAAEEPGGGRQRPERDASRVGRRSGLAVGRDLPLATLRRGQDDRPPRDRTGDPGREPGRHRRGTRRPVPRYLLAARFAGLQAGRRKQRSLPAWTPAHRVRASETSNAPARAR